VIDSALTHQRPARLGCIEQLVILGTLLALVGPAYGAHALEGWRAFSSDRGRFSVEFPTAPVEQDKEKWFPISSFKSRVYTARVEDDAFGVNHTDIPSLVMAFASRSKIFSSTRDGFLEDANSTEISFEKASLAGHEARILHYDMPATSERPHLKGKATILFIDKRLYVFWAEVTLALAQSEIDRFFSSIEFIAAD